MARQGVKRKLDAILVADAVGFSRLAEADEAGAYASLKSHLWELLEPTIAQHEGRVIKSTGDGLLADFDSVVDAVECAAEIQRGMARRNQGVPEDRRIDFRIGVNLGDIIIVGDDIHGSGVNIAARLRKPSGPASLKRCTQSRRVCRSMPQIVAAAACDAPSTTAAIDNSRRA